jgi:hypothetical protein
MQQHVLTGFCHVLAVTALRNGTRHSSHRVSVALAAMVVSLIHMNPTCQAQRADAATKYLQDCSHQVVLHQLLLEDLLFQIPCCSQSFITRVCVHCAGLEQLWFTGLTDRAVLLSMCTTYI